MIPDLKKFEVWFVTGSQHLYGPAALKQVAANSRKVAQALNDAAAIPCKVVFKPVVKTPQEIYDLCSQADNAKNCIGLITWMHTFSPAKMWIAGLKALRKPFLHLHTQFNRDLPWSSIDMDFMNLNQAAHGDREFGFICTRMRLNRKVVVGHWQDSEVQNSIGVWLRAASAWHDMRGMKIARFGDNMRQVAVTEGDKVDAQIRFNFTVDGFGVGDLVAAINKVRDSQIDALVNEYKKEYKMTAGADKTDSIREAAKIEAGMRTFLEKGGFKAFTTTFEDLHGLIQLPGLAVQRLMADGYGFGAEGDWKTAALVRALKVMAAGLKGGSSFMEDYTYHLNPKQQKVLGAHMLEVCSSIADGKPSLEVHPLGIGGKADPVRVVFSTPAGDALNASLIDLGNRFRLIVNTVKVVKPDAPLPKLPVARVVWIPQPNLKVAAAAWIYAGGAHHTAFTMALTPEYLEDFAKMADVEFVLIDDKTSLSGFQKELRSNEIFYAFSKGL
jgi:L-arabinose isomerase